MRILRIVPTAQVIVAYSSVSELNLYRFLSNLEYLNVVIEKSLTIRVKDASIKIRA